jgi:hypothetical protein
MILPLFSGLLKPPIMRFACLAAGVVGHVENMGTCFGPSADAHERQLTGCLNFLSEIARNLTGTSGFIVPIAGAHT